MDKLIKVELGCGKTKSEGYIGIDRFPLPGVDIVADLNDKIPIEDNSVDVLFACHSLEHFKDIKHIMQEIYRICKPNAIIHILAPYYNTTTNLANYYHMQVFNEETFRFFDSAIENNFIDVEDWDSPHSYDWGLSASDNSENEVMLAQIGVEYFYYKEYRNLTENQKRHLRRSISNVCDQLFYTLIVVKGDRPSYEQLQELKNKAKQLEPPVISQLRARDQQKEDKSSILKDIQQIAVEKVRLCEEKLEQVIDQNNERLYNAIQQSDRKVEDIVDAFRQRIEMLEKQQQELNLNLQTLKIANEQTDKISNQIIQNQAVQTKINKNIALATDLLELSRPEKLRFKRKYMTWSNTENLDLAVKMIAPEFADGLELHSSEYKKSNRICVSPIIPHDDYLEYLVSGYGSHLKLFLFGSLGTNIFLETVIDGVICGQLVVELEYQGVYEIQHKATKQVYIRIRQVGDIGIVRTMEISNRTCFIFEKRTLAAYLE